jgi:DNA/RNA-binding domain of Phe-tRNA-synthetase-like protein
MKVSLSVAPDIFAAFPTFRRGLVVAVGLDNEHDAAGLQDLLAEAVRQAQANPIDLDGDPRCREWKAAHQQLGSNPNRFPPAHIALRKRAQRPGAALPFINNAVAVMNYCSLLGTLPVGGDDLDHVGPALQLRRATGAETFVPLDRPDTLERPEPGEVIYADEGGQVLCRRWNWRNGSPSRLRAETCRLALNVDGLGAGCLDEVVRIRDLAAELFARHCGARVVTGLLTPEHPVAELSVPDAEPTS